MGDADALARLALASVDAGDLRSALAAAEEAVARDARSPAAHTALGWVLENLGEERLQEAARAYERAIALDPGALSAKEGLANVLRRLGRPAEADALAAEVVALAAGDPRPETLELRGWCELQLGRLADAERSFRRALEQEPELVSVRLDLALTLLCAGRPSEALTAYDEAIATADRLGDLHGVLAIALDDLEQALAARPELAPTPAAAAARERLRAASTGSAPAPMGGA
jgi:protein O-GlcNAc transferase